MKNTPLVAQTPQIESRIYEIRGQKVMLDFDLAEIYGIETKRLKEQVKRNIKRFIGDDFMFELTKEEALCSRSHFATLNKGRGSNIKYLPLAFTELGVAMLSSVLNSDAAIEANRNIMRAFVYMRQVVLNARSTSSVSNSDRQVQDLKQYIEEVFTDYNDINEDTRMQLELINQSLAELHAQNRLVAERSQKRIGFVQQNEIVD